MRLSWLKPTTALALVLAAQASVAQQEAPMLAEQVAAGALPPVEERLPENPRVIGVSEAIGEYGGTWRRAFKGPSDRWGPTKLMEERVLRAVMDADQNISYVPGWVESYEANEDSTVFTFKLRAGHRWSDGAPVTTRDVQFWYEDVFQNREIMPSVPALYTAAGEPMIIDIVDELTFTVTFAGSYPLFLTILAKESTGKPGLDRPGFIEPFHYLKNFHPTYADPEALAAVMEENGAQKWTDLWDSKGQIQAWWFNPDMPVLTAWRVATPPPADTVVMERNPYYYAVDAEGNQLPYIDRIEHRLFQDTEAMNLMVVQGEIDLQSRHLNAADFTLFKENEGAGDYEVVTWTKASTWTIYPNLNTPDETLRGLFDDKRVREALNVAIDRDTINELVFSGLGEARQAGPVSGSPFFDAELEVAGTAYDPDKANALLDEAGLTERDVNGYRLRPDGKRMTVVVQTRHNALLSMLELVQADWAEIGVEALVRNLDRTLVTQNVETGDFEMVLDSFDRSSIITADPVRFLGRYGYGHNYFKWWSSGGTNGVEPPADHPIRDVWTAWESAQSASSLEEANGHAQDMVSIFKENLWTIGLIGETPAIYVKANDLSNFPEGLIDDDALRGIGLAQSAQFYIDK
ncbi:Oligopeptide ABC transporter, periplasmic oligopeptide-binding protein OppA [Candidatus Rhodobacter oscarellae]|uniref:Oligopeptide ABC transporter, periplasmic oligopeptide-binding protein OppA n=1 Tax=Candidatus Rhodobacter oscarellae TaxID=1675527 RepID=A0A0J9E1Z4_9RHOB|nr:ABC transporter substrate-binding protein [Candidatus Rhodobacter lobularis]KMW56891.1 Oligopeptide ABC transporter, periplasmic oligopeptide-binding protein OppA [Candidatus Rhodobacter lobularis]